VTAGVLQIIAVSRWIHKPSHSVNLQASSSCQSSHQVNQPLQKVGLRVSSHLSLALITLGRM